MPGLKLIHVSKRGHYWVSRSYLPGVAAAATPGKYKRDFKNVTYISASTQFLPNEEFNRNHHPL